ncbi:hypothetical protein BD779DRAFT_1480552 [Infundibulicybe gibba]|nr:hypothetical protein BD779DRAFT_1480552 [Infundibulicybe gibba]
MYLAACNARHAAARVRAGKVGKIIDMSLEREPRKDVGGGTQEIEKDFGKQGAANEQAFSDLTDRRNEDFIYVLNLSAGILCLLLSLRSKFFELLIVAGAYLSGNAP